MMRSIQLIALYILVIGFFSCKKEYTSPFPGDDAYKTVEGQLSILVGMKQRFAVNSSLGNGSVFLLTAANGFTTFEISSRGGANQDFNNLASGLQTLSTSNAVIRNLWINTNLTLKTADNLLANTQYIKDSSVNRQIRRYALLYKAMAVGVQSAFWEKVIVHTSENASFTDRRMGMKEALSWLEQATSIPETITSASPYYTFFGTEINVKNSINAIAARLYLEIGEYDAAIAKAALVELNSRSVFFYNSNNPNPLFSDGFTNGFGFLNNPHFGLPTSLQPPANDGRRIFYLTGTGTTGYGFGRSDKDSIPVYLPGEMLLIQAEGYARKNDLVNAKKFLDLVLTKTPSQDVFRIGAGLPAYAGTMDQPSLLTEIYKNRCVELMNSGQKLQDSRRFDRPGPESPVRERNRNFYPYPFQERNANPNTPADPAI